MHGYYGSHFLYYIEKTFGDVIITTIWLYLTTDTEVPSIHKLHIF